MEITLFDAIFLFCFGFMSSGLIVKLRKNKITTFNIINLIFDVYNTSQNTDTVKADQTKKPRYKSSFIEKT